MCKTKIYHPNIDYDGCIYSKDDLILQGDGILNVTSNYSDAIVSTDDLKIVSGTYNIKSQDDGIRGKDSVYILDGTINVESNADGIKSTNDTDSTKGFVYIKNGTFVINSVEDAIQAQTKLIIDEGNFDTLPLGLIFTPESMITVCSHENKIINSFNVDTAKFFDTRHKANFMLNILFRAAKFYLRYLNLINKQTESIEDSLKKTTHNKALFQLMEIQKSLVYFTTALKDNQLVLQKLLRMVNAPYNFGKYDGLYGINH